MTTVLTPGRERRLHELFNDSPFGPAVLEPLDDAIDWVLRGLEISETNRQRSELLGVLNDAIHLDSGRNIKRLLGSLFKVGDRFDTLCDDRNQRALLGCIAHFHETNDVLGRWARASCGVGSWEEAVNAFERMSRITRAELPNYCAAFVQVGRPKDAAKRLKRIGPENVLAGDEWLRMATSGHASNSPRCNCSDFAAGTPAGPTSPVLKMFLEFTDDCYDAMHFLCLDCHQIWNKERGLDDDDWAWNRSQRSWFEGNVWSAPFDGDDGPGLEIIRDAEAFAWWVVNLESAVYTYTLP